MTLLADSRSGRRSGLLPWTLLVIGSAASLAANVAVAECQCRELQRLPPAVFCVPVVLPAGPSQRIKSLLPCYQIGASDVSLCRFVRDSAGFDPASCRPMPGCAVTYEHPPSTQDRGRPHDHGLQVVIFGSGRTCPKSLAYPWACASWHWSGRSFSRDGWPR